MEIITAIFSGAYDIMQNDLTVFGFTFSYWDVLIWGLAATVIGILIVRFLWN